MVIYKSIVTLFFIGLLILSGCNDINNKLIETNNKNIETLNCEVNSDCVPASCCHPNSCINKDNAPSCFQIMCSQNCAPNSLDCGQGSCQCINNQCGAIFNE